MTTPERKSNDDMLVDKLTRQLGGRDSGVPVGEAPDGMFPPTGEKAGTVGGE